MPLLAALLLAPAAIVLDPRRSRGVWEGWGTSLCWMGNPFGTRADVADLLFTRGTVRIGDESLPGLGLNVVRYNAGACSDALVEGRRMVLSKAVLPYRRMQGFWLDGKSPDPDSRSWDWTADAGQRALMLGAKRRGADRFELFSNSPPWWMCANDNPSGAPDPKRDNLRPEMRSAFATYLATVAAQAPRRWGVRFTSVEPFNEPASPYWGADGRQEGCHFAPATQAAVLPLLRAELDRQGLRETPIAASDETSFDRAIATWSAFDAPTRALVDRLNVHGYAYWEPARAVLDRVLSGKPRWNSEHGDGDATGLSTARELSLDLSILHPTAWCYWQPLDGGGWGLLDCDMVAAKVRKANPKLFVLAQYTRHLREGMTILDTGDPDAVAAYDLKARRLVVVLVGGKEPATRTLDLAAFALRRPKTARWTTEPKAAARYRRDPDLPLTGTTLTVDLPADSVQTFQIDGVTVR